VTAPAVPTFAEYVASLSAVSTAVAGTEPEALDLCIRATSTLQVASPLDREILAALIGDDPAIVPVLAAALGLSQERFKGWLTEHFGTAGWVKLGRQRPSDLAAELDDDLGILAALQTQAERDWTWADVLARTMAPRQRAGSAVQQGRDLEDAAVTWPRVRATRSVRGNGGPDGAGGFRDPGQGLPRRGLR